MSSDNKIVNYGQIYDYLKTIKLDEYLSNKRTIIHNQIFDRAIDKLIFEVNSQSTVLNISNKIKNLLSEYNITEFSKENFRFIEYKGKIWYEPSTVSIIYTKNLVLDNKGHYIRLRIGPLNLKELWDNEYVLLKDIDRINKASDTEKYVIDYIDYVSGYVILYDKVNLKHITVDISYIHDITKYEHNNFYGEMFSIKK